MSEEDRPYGLGLSTTAVEKRRKQLEAWRNSDTNLEPGDVAYRSPSRVKFSKGVMFLAAVSNGDEKEVERLLTEDNANVNYANSDGMTAAHQCCIDDDIEMLKLLVRHGADIHLVDNEGWTPLHAAASCGFDHIVRYLLNCGAFPAAVNNEGQTPSELGEDFSDIVEMIDKEVESQGIDVEEVRCEEEKVMLEDAKKLVANPHLDPIISPGGATPLHVAAAKNYTTVLNVLLSIVGQDIDARDDDGWTPLHAAVYWGSIEAAELLILSGANMYNKTDAGETFDDLIDPDLTEEEIAKLKKLNTCVNPEQEPRKRRPQVSRQRSITSMNNQNSMDSKTGGITSPGVKRRLSKEKVIASKMIDMKKEKEDLMLSFEKVAEEPADGGGGVSNSSVPNTVPDANHVPPPTATSTQSSTDESSADTQYFSRSGSITGSNSPKNARRKGEISQKMLERLHLFETTNTNPTATTTTTTTTTTSGTTAVTTGGVSSSASGSPLPSSPRTSTPLNSPSVGHLDERRTRIDGSDGPHRSRVASLDVSKSTSAGGTTPPFKKFSFQPKPVSSKAKSMSLDRGESSFFKKAFDKVASVELNSNTKRDKLIEHPKQIKPVEQVKPVKPVEQVKPVIPVEQVKSFETVKPVEQSKPVATETTLSPTRKGSLLSTASPISGSTPKGECSTDSIASKDRTTSFVHPEAKRKVAARNKRESRRSTQPVPSDFLQQIKQHDELVEKELERSLGKDTGNDTKTQSQNNTSQLPEAKGLVRKLSGGQNEIIITEGDKTTTSSSSSSQSAYKPASRPASKLISDEESTSQVLLSETLSAAAPPPPPTDQNMLTVPTEGGTTNSSSSPSGTRSRSNTKRKKLKEKRRSTGIAEPEGDEEIPENLKGIFHRHQGSNDSTDSSSTSGGGQVASVLDGVVGIDESSISTAAIEYYQQEIDKLKQLLNEEKEKTKKVTQDYNNACLQVEHKSRQIVELQRKYEDTNRAYVQEKTDKEEKDKKIQQLEKSDKTIHELQSEIQRLKDENGALIRVVGKLSRAPFSS